MQMVLNPDTLTEYGGKDGGKKGSYCSPAPVSNDEIDDFCHSVTGHKGPVWDVTQVCVPMCLLLPLHAAAPRAHGTMLFPLVANDS